MHHDFYAIQAARTALKMLVVRRATNGDPVAADAYMRTKGWDRDVVQAIKANVSGFEDADVAGGNAIDFARAVSSASIVSRLPAVRRLPPRLSLMTPASRLIGTIRGEGLAIVPTPPTVYTRVQIQLRKVVALLVTSNDALQNPLVEEALATDLLAACVDALNLATLDGSTGSLTAGISPIDSSVASLAELDIALHGAIDALVNAGGSLTSSAFVMPAWLGAHLGLIRGTGGSLCYPEVGATGGQIAKIPVLTFDDIVGPGTDGGAISLIDGALIGLSEDRAELTTSDDTMIEMSTLPTGDTITPVAASAVRVGMFDADATAIKATLRAGFVIRRAGAVQVISGISL